MNYINHIKSGLLAMTFAASVGTVLTGCKEDILIDAAQSTKLETVDGKYGYVRSAAGAQALTPITLFGNQAGTGHLYFELSKAAERDIAVKFEVDPAALEAYNKANGTAYQMYPIDKLSLANDGAVTIPMGAKKSSNVELSIQSGGAEGGTYAVAVSATANDGVVLSNDNLSYIYLIKPMPAIPDTRKGDVLTFCFVEVNDENILTCGEYFMKDSKKPFFDVVSIFAANINVNSETGRVNVQCNDQVTFLLKNVDKFVRPLQAKGIKVNLTILGNHDEAGMGNLSKEAAADFAKELKAYMDIYGLDGVDFDDEYSKYADNPSPGFLPRSRANFARLVYECRQVMPDKLLGIYEYLSTFEDSPTGVVEGKTVGELVDYMTYGYYQNQADYLTRGKGREANFEGLPKSKYCPTPLKINHELDGGWKNFKLEYIEDMKAEGYGLQMFYNPDPSRFSYEQYFTAVSEVLFNEKVEWTGKYYSRTSDAPIVATKLNYESYLGEWEATSSNSLFYYFDEEENPKWWDWGGKQKFSEKVRIEEKEAGKSYYVYNWGSYPDITGKYPMVMDYNPVDGKVKISMPQTIHSGDATDPITWEMRWGTYTGGPTDWKFYSAAERPEAMTGIVDVKGVISMKGAGNRYAIDPCYDKDGKFVPPHMDIKYHVSENYVLIKK